MTRERSQCKFDLDAAHRLLRSGKSYRAVAENLQVNKATLRAWTDEFPYVEPPKPKPVANPPVPKSMPMAAPDLKKQIETAARDAARFERQVAASPSTVLQTLGDKPPTPSELGIVGLDELEPGKYPSVWLTSNPHVAMICETHHPIILLKQWHPSLATHPVFTLAQTIWHFREPVFAREPDEAWNAAKRLSDSLMADPQIRDRVRDVYDITHVPFEAVHGERSAPIEPPPPMFNGPKRETYHFDLDRSESVPGSAGFAF